MIINESKIAFFYLRLFFRFQCFQWVTADFAKIFPPVSTAIPKNPARASLLQPHPLPFPPAPGHPIRPWGNRYHDLRFLPSNCRLARPEFRDRREPRDSRGFPPRGVRVRPFGSCAQNRRPAALPELRTRRGATILSYAGLIIPPHLKCPSLCPPREPLCSLPRVSAALAHLGIGAFCTGRIP